MYQTRQDLQWPPTVALQGLWVLVYPQQRRRRTSQMVLRIFITWIISKRSLSDIAAQYRVSPRTLQRKFEYFWLIQPPQPADPARVYDQLFIDGTYFNTKCLLIAATTDHIVTWHWCYTEDSKAYGRLFDQLPAPGIVTTDGQNGALKALQETWEDTKIQCCLVHVQRNIRTATGLHPTTACGKALRELSLQLLKISDLDQAAEWMKSLHNFGTVFGDYLNERTYVKDVAPDQIPRSKRKNKSWWYTHETHRRGYRLLVKLANNGQLFTFLTEADSDETPFKRTTNSLEGGANSPVKDLIHAHRGLRDEHQRIACQWWLYLHTELPDDPVMIARQQNWGKDALAKVNSLITQEKQATSGREDGAPATYDNAIDADYNHSTGIRKGHVG